MTNPLSVEAVHTEQVVAPAVLVVEDDFIIGSDLERRLQEAGFNVIGVASSAAEAIELAEKMAPRLAVMDIRLAGGVDGLDTAIDMVDRLGIRSIFVTAHGDPATRDRAARARPLGWLQKPYAPESLISLIRTALSAA